MYAHSTKTVLALIVGVSMVSAMVYPRGNNNWTDPASLQSQIITATNNYRSQHQVGPVTWNATIADAASTWASQCKFSLNSDPYGKNLGGGYGTPADLVDAWAAGEKSYNYSDPGFTIDSGAFSQLVWKASTQVGCGAADCSKENLGFLCFCYYSPPGNIAGKFENNVFNSSSE